jgi:hypothetical protein
MGGPGSGRKKGGGKSVKHSTKTINTTGGKQKIKGFDMPDGSFHVSRFPNAKKRK